MWAKSKFLKHMIIFAFIPLVLSIGLAPAMSFGNIFGTPKKQMDDGVPKMFPNDIAGAIPIDRTRGIKAKIIICFRNFDFAHMPKAMRF